MIAGLATCVALVGVACFARKAPKAAWAKPTPRPLPALRMVLANKYSYPVLWSGSVVFGIYFVVQAIIGKKLLQDCYGLSSAASAGYTFLMMVTSTVSVGLSGFLCALIGNRRRPLLIAGSCGVALAAVGMIVNLSTQADAHGVLFCYLLLGVAVGCNPLYSCSMKELNQPDSAATSVGVMNAYSYVNLAVLVTLTGVALDAFSGGAVVTPSAIIYPIQAYRFVFTAFLVLSLCSLLAAFLVRETRGHTVWQREVSSPVPRKSPSEAFGHR